MLLLCGLNWGLQGQDAINILRTNESIYNQALYGKNTLLKGNVKIEYDGSILTADQVLVKDQNAGFAADKNVIINQGDTLFLKGDKATYASSTKLAIVKYNVELEDKDLFLNGPQLNYNRALSEAYYNDRSRIRIKKNNDFIESNFGHYYSLQNLLTFTDSVIYEAEDFTMTGNDLSYNTSNELISYTTGATTTRKSDSSVFYSLKAKYYQQTHDAYFYGDVIANNAGLEFCADSVYYNDSTNIALAYNHIEMEDSVNNWILLAPYAENYRDQDSVSIPYRSEMIMLNGQDSIHLFSDSLSIFGNSGEKKIVARGNVTLSGQQFKGACKTLVYEQFDSTITMISSPVLWQDSSQIVGEKITLTLGDDGVKNMFIPRESFITEKVGSDLYNQIKGRELTAYFLDGKMNNIIIKGNGQSIYHAFDEGKDGSGNIIKKYIGVNQSECSDMEIVMRVNEGGVASIKFLTKPENSLTPAAIIKKGESFFLKDFGWLENKKPSLDKEKLSFNWLFSPKTIETPKESLPEEQK
jgi:lipopolysaccharide export system protein LptA